MRVKCSDTLEKKVGRRGRGGVGREGGGVGWGVREEEEKESGTCLDMVFYLEQWGNSSEFGVSIIDLSLNCITCYLYDAVEVV